MRIGEVAALSGVSARSIRHYHRVGALAEPPRTAGGYREYDVADLLRIMRIAFLSGSGVPLREVAGLLDAEVDGRRDAEVDGRASSATSATADLDALRADIDARIEALTRQRARLEIVAERATAGLPLGLLPAEVAHALDACRAEAAGEPALAALLDRERDLLDLLALSADFPTVLAESYAEIGSDPARRAAYLDLMRGFHAIEGRAVEEVGAEIDALVDLLAADPALRQLMASPASDPEGPTLEQLVPDPAQREVVRRVLARLEDARSADS